MGEHKKTKVNEHHATGQFQVEREVPNNSRKPHDKTLTNYGKERREVPKAVFYQKNLCKN